MEDASEHEMGIKQNKTAIAAETATVIKKHLYVYVYVYMYMSYLDSCDATLRATSVMFLEQINLPVLQGLPG